VETYELDGGVTLDSIISEVDRLWRCLQSDEAFKREVADENVEMVSAPRSRSLGQYDTFQLALIAALVAYRCGAWSQAREFAERAIDRLRKRRGASDDEGDSAVSRANLRELEYFATICVRFELSEIIPQHVRGRREVDALRHRFELTVRAHKLALEDAAERFDFFDAARANGELGTLYLTAISIELIHPEFRLLRSLDVVDRLSIQAVECFRLARTDLEANYPEATSASGAYEGSRLIEQLYFKVCMNLVSAFTFLSMGNCIMGNYQQHG
jgi:hypothetical protein